MENQSASPTLLSIRVAILGDPQVGKRTYIQKLASKQNEHLLNPNSLSLCENQASFQLNSNLGPCQITLVYIDIDIQQSQANGGIIPEDILAKLKSCSNAMFMFSLLTRASYKNIPYYYRAWRMAKQQDISVLISNKLDDHKNIKIKQKMIIFHRKKNIGYFTISTKAAYNLLEPFLYFFKKNLKTQQFKFINSQNFVDLQANAQIVNKQEIENQIKIIKCWDLPEDSDQM